MGQQQSKSSIYLRITLGETQSHQLFDFQTTFSGHQHPMTQSQSYLVDKGETVQFLTQEQFHSTHKHTLSPQMGLLKVNIQPHNQILITNLTPTNHRNILWRCIKPNQTHPIKPGDIIKIGKIKLELKKIVQTKQQSYLEQETVKDYHESLSENNQDLQSLRSGHSSCDRCRICFRSFNVKNDPLLCLCKCSGSIKWIHFLCLKDWIANNFSKREDQHCKFYTYQQTNCQLCKHNLPNEFKHQGRYYSFLDFSTFEPPYAEFEYIQMENNKRKFYKYIISLMKDKEVVIGRNNSSQVVMKDISISRTHCSLEYNHGVLLLRDKKSKFGTLVKLEKQTDFSSENGLQLQYDSKIIELFNNNTFKTCCQDIDTYRLIYQNSPEGQSNDITNINRQQNNPFRIDGIANDNSAQGNEFLVEESLSSNQSHHYLQRVIQEALNFSQGYERSAERQDSARVTMIRETIARDEAIRY